VLEKGDEAGEKDGEQLFYKLANLDDRIKNADQVGGMQCLGMRARGCRHADEDST
jgi:hypothetical protein